MSDREIRKRTGWSQTKVTDVCRRLTWGGVKVADVDSLLEACGLSWSAQRRTRWLIALALGRGGIEGIKSMRHLKPRSGTESSQLNSIVRVVLRAVSAEATQWMVEQRRPLNLGFVTLLAVPFRANWKEIVAAKLKHFKLAGMFNLPGREKRLALEEAGLPQALCSPDNIGLTKTFHRRMHYTIEATPSNRFEKDVNIIEMKRKACGHISYVASFEKSVEMLYGSILDALESYIRKINSPFAKVSESSTTGGLRFLPTSGNKAKVRGVPIRKLPVHIVPLNSNFSVFGEKGPSSPVYAKAPPVRALPAIPQAADDLRGRDEQRSLVEPRPEGADGVLLSDATKGVTEGEPVLSGPEAATVDSLRVD